MTIDCIHRLPAPFQPKNNVVQKELKQDPISRLGLEAEVALSMATPLQNWQGSIGLSTPTNASVCISTRFIVALRVAVEEHTRNAIHQLHETRVERSSCFESPEFANESKKNAYNDVQYPLC